MDHYLKTIKAGSLHVAIAGTYQGLDGVAAAHRALASGGQPGKHVVVLA
ncbi:hypothetical protein [Arthrobacter sp. UYP6]